MPTLPLPVQADSSGTPPSTFSATANRSVTATIVASNTLPSTPPLVASSLPSSSSSLGLVSAPLQAPSPSSPAPLLPSSRSPEMLDRLVQAANRAKTHMGAPTSPPSISPEQDSSMPLQLPEQPPPILPLLPKRPPPSTPAAAAAAASDLSRGQGLSSDLARTPGPLSPRGIESLSVSGLGRPLPALPLQGETGEDGSLSPKPAVITAGVEPAASVTPAQAPILRKPVAKPQPSLDQDDPFLDVAELPEISMLSLGEDQANEPNPREKALPQTPQPTTTRLSMQGSTNSLPYLVEPTAAGSSSASTSSLNSVASRGSAPSLGPPPLRPPAPPFAAAVTAAASTEATRWSLAPHHQGYLAAGHTAPPDVVIAPPSPLLPLPPATLDHHQHHTAPYPAPPPSSNSQAPPLSFLNTGYDPMPPAQTLPLPDHHYHHHYQEQHDRPPSYIAQAGNRGSMIIAQAPTEDQMFEVSVLSQPLAHDSGISSNNSGSNSNINPITCNGGHGTSSPPSSTSSSFSSSSSSTPHQFISASAMHDQQYLLLGCANALHSIDLTLPAHERKVRTHIQGISFKEIHCLEDIGLVVVIAGRNNRVRCYDYESIKKLVEYGHSQEGRGRVVEGGRLGPVKHKIQLRVETALSSSAREGGAVPTGGPSSSPLGKTSRFLQRASYHPGQPQPPPTAASRQTPLPISTSHDATASAGYAPGHRHTASLDRNLLSPLDAEPALSSEAPLRPKRARPLSFGALASLAHVRSSTKEQPVPAPGGTNGPTTIGTAATSATTTGSVAPSAAATAAAPLAPVGTVGSEQNTTTTTKGKRFAQVASYLSQAATSSHLVAPVQDRPSEAAMDWAWDFVKLRQTKDVMSLDFHYTPTTVFMTVLSKSGIDIFRRPKSARGIARPAFRIATASSSRGSSREGSEGGGGGGSVPGTTGAGATGTMTGTGIAQGADGGTGGGMMATTGGGSGTFNSNHFDVHRTKQERNPHDWEPFKQFYHPEPPSFMTVVKTAYAVTDIILGKAHRACVVHVEDMTVKDLYRDESTPSMFQGLSKKLGFRLSMSSSSSSSSGVQMWHSFEKIPYDVPAHVLYPDTVDALYGTSSGRRHSPPPYQQGRRRSSIGGAVVDHHYHYQQQPAFSMRHHGATRPVSFVGPPTHQPSPFYDQDNDSFSSCGSSSSPGSTPSSNSPSWPPQAGRPSSSQAQYPWGVHGPLYASSLPPALTSSSASAAAAAAAAAMGPRKARMVTSDQVLNLAFSRPTSKQLFLATYGNQSRMVDLTGRPVSGVVIDWGAHVPQQVEFLRAAMDIYVVGFERTRIMIYSLTRGVKVKEILRSGSTWCFDGHHQRQQQHPPIHRQPEGQQQQQQQQQRQGGSSAGSRQSMPPLPVGSSFSTPSSPAHHPTPTHGGHSPQPTHHPLLPSAMTMLNHGSTHHNPHHHHHHGSSAFKFLARDIDDDSFFFSHSHGKQGATVCRLGLAQLEQDDFEVHGWY